MTEPYVFFDDLEPEAVEVRASEIEACEDGDQLAAWLAGFERVMDDVSAEVKARLLTGRAREDWLHRTADMMAFLGRGISQIKRRRKTLGLYDPRVEHIGKLDIKIAHLKTERAFGNAFIRAAGEVLTPEQMADLGRRAREEMAAEGVVLTSPALEAA